MLAERLKKKKLYRKFTRQTSKVGGQLDMSLCRQRTGGAGRITKDNLYSKEKDAVSASIPGR